MSNKLQLFVVGGGVVEEGQNGYVARTQIAEYLEGFSRFYAKVTWATLLSGDGLNTTTLGSVGVQVISDRRRTSVYSCEGLRDQIRHYFVFSKSIDRNTDVIVSNLSLTSFIYIVLARLFGRKTLLYVGSDPLLAVKLQKAYLRKLAPLINLLVAPASAALANSVCVRGEAIRRFFHRWNRRCFLSKPIVAYKAFERGPHLFGNRVKVKLLYVGKLEENKGIGTLIACLLGNEGRSLRRHARLEIVGSGPDEQAYRALTFENAIEDSVRFSGFVDDAAKLARIFRQADFLIVPSEVTEGFPRVIDEAFLSGLPVICTPIGGMKYLADNAAVTLVMPKNVDALRAVLCDVALDEKKRKLLKAAAESLAKDYLRETASEQHAHALAN